MKLFSRLYERVMRWSVHPLAPRYLAGLSFAESSFFPVPPDVMLAPMSLATPAKAWNYALITLLASVAGGIAGYLLGYLAFDWLEPWIRELGYWEKYQLSQQWFAEWGVWVVFIAGFSPVPYKIFTVSAGALSMAFLPFVLASVVGRGLRFYMVAGLMVWGGARMEPLLRKYMDIIGWLVVFAAVTGYVTYRWM